MFLACASTQQHQTRSTLTILGRATQRGLVECPLGSSRKTHNPPPSPPPSCQDVFARLQRLPSLTGVDGYCCSRCEFATKSGHQGVCPCYAVTKKTRACAKDSTAGRETAGVCVGVRLRQIVHNVRPRSGHQRRRGCRRSRPTRRRLPGRRRCRCPGLCSFGPRFLRQGNALMTRLGGDCVERSRGID